MGWGWGGGSSGGIPPPNFPYLQTGRSWRTSSATCWYSVLAVSLSSSVFSMLSFCWRRRRDLQLVRRTKRGSWQSNLIKAYLSWALNPAESKMRGYGYKAKTSDSHIYRFKQCGKKRNQPHMKGAWKYAQTGSESCSHFVWGYLCL